jgi:Protein of unknown function (DUF4238)
MAGPRQHTTPRFHLAQFAGNDPKGCVWVYDADSQTSRPSVPESVGVERNFYSVKRTDGTWDTTIDDWITGVESKAEPIYRRLLSGELPEDDTQEKYDFALYLAVMLARTTAHRQKAAQAYAHFAQIRHYAVGIDDQAFASHVAAYERKTSEVMPTEVRERVRAIMLDPSDFIVQVPKEVSIPGLLVIDDLAPLFLKMRWSMFVPANGFFITSDNPILHRNNPARRHLIQHGFRDKTAEITFPLSPQRTLLLTWARWPPPAFALQRRAVDELNKAVAINSERFLYAHIEHRHIAKLSRTFGATKPRMRFGGFGPKNFSEVRLKR